LLANLVHLPAVRLVVVTAPGADVLPWDQSVCTHAEGVMCSGRLGCRVDERRLDEWESRLQREWARMQRAILGRLRRCGYSSPLAVRVNEPQRRGCTHLNIVLDWSHPGARLYFDSLVELAPRYGFGYVDRRSTAMPGRQAANYLTSYFTGKNKPEAVSVVGAAAAADRYQRVHSISPRLTRASGVTFRTLAHGRRMFCVREFRIDPPAIPASGSYRFVLDGAVYELATGERLRLIWPQPPPPSMN
jgi:hypothetical protein